MHVASIVPVKNLHLTKDNTYHLCLLQEVNKSITYANFFRERANEGKYVILDNGAAEGEYPSIEQLAYGCVWMGAQELVLPDVFFDGDKTAKAVSDAFSYLGMNKLPFKTMAVPQGRTLKDWLSCAREIIRYPVNCLGIPKNLVHSLGPEGRLTVVGQLIRMLVNANRRDIEIHLLGCWEDPREVGALHRYFGHRIRGVDSGIAAMYTQEGLELDINKYPKPGDNKPFLRFDNEDLDEELLKNNIARWEGYCYGKLL